MKVLKLKNQDLLTNLRFRLVMVRVTGGEAPGGSSLAPKIGPLGLVRFTFIV